MKTRETLAIFNRGRISKLALARTDVSRVALSASIQTNWMPRTLGSMSLRPGLGYNGAFAGDGAIVPFIFANDDTALIELSAGQMRVWESGDTLLSRPSVSASVTNGALTSDLSGWTDADDAGAASAWASGAMQLLGSGSGYARRRQQVTIGAGQGSTAHALRIVVGRGPLLLRVGSTAGADDVFRQAVLRTGTHSIAFEPGGNFWIEFSSALTYPVLVDSCEVEASGVVSMPTPWDTVDRCKAARWEQSADVVYVACEGLQQQRIERRPNGSWSLVAYESNKGPYLTENLSSTTLTPSAIEGEITLTASSNVFEAGHAGAIFRMESQGQTVADTLSSELSFTDPIRVTGVANTRIFQINRAGTWSGTLSLQRSVGAVGSWEEVATYTANGVASYDDGLDNAIVFYRIGFQAGNYSSGTASVNLDYAVGSITGVVRITAVASETSASAVVLTPLGGSDATDVWAEGAWSSKEGWPAAVAISEGRLWWSGNGRNYGSVSDAFDNFDPDFEGDAAPINRRIGEGATNNPNWILPLQRLMVGTDQAEHSVRSNSLDEPITPSNYNTKRPSTKGSAPVPAVVSDGRGYFVDRTQKKLFELQYDGSLYDFASLDLTLLVPEIGASGFTRIAVQQNPDMRLHAVRLDGTVGLLVRDQAEDVLCWVDIETDGFVEDVAVLPGPNGDRVFYRVRRVIDGATVRYNEEWALEARCIGGTLNLQADSFITGSGSVTGLDHLEGKQVVIWADGADRGTATVSGGSVAGSYTSWMAGLGYTAQYKSAKLVSAVRELGSTMIMRSRIDRIGLILADTHAQGVQYGPSFDVMDDLPLVEDGALVDSDSIWSEYDEDVIEFSGDWGTDNRVCLTASAPRPCTVSGVLLVMDRQNAA